MNFRFNESLDNVHSVIYFTSFEKKVINTPFFQRLHDVNQSSTVYLTFPTNRTKRYEHSLGVMQIASDLFYNASINASNNGALDKLMTMISSEFEKVIAHHQYGKNLVIDNLDEEVKGLIDFLNGECTSIEVAKNLLDEKFYDVFSETCLFDLIPRGIKNGYYGFLYICMLEAIRLAGLMHDLGHPPQSHIIEEDLKNVYDELSTKRNHEEKKLTSREENYMRIFDKYNNLDSDDLKHIDEDMAIKTKNRKTGALHEMIGLHMVRKVFNWVLPDILNSYAKKRAKKRNGYLPESEIMCLFYLTVEEFVFGLLRDKTSLFISMHKIIDGTIDADRLDFIQRDSQNTGMVWGKLSYKRIINTAMLEEVYIGKEGEGNQESEDDYEETIRVCFSNKSITELDETLINRFKDYALINLHHRNVRIEHMYKSIIRIMMDEYLHSAESDSACDKLIINDISGLWRNLEFKYNENNSMLCIMQWNDVWLNGLLQNRLVEHYYDASLKGNNKLCLAYLKEIFLNEGKHISVIKRQSELMQINKAIKDTVNDFRIKLGDFLDENNNDLSEDDVLKYEELCDLYYSLENPLDWSLWIKYFGVDFIRLAIEQKLKENKKICDFMVVPITFSDGANMRDVFIYNVAGVVNSYDLYSDVNVRMEIERESFPYYYVYVRFSDKKMPKASKKQVEYFESIRQSIGVAVGESLIKKISEYEINGGRIGDE